MSMVRRLFVPALVLALASVSVPALAQGTKEVKGKIVQVDPAAKRIIVEESQGRKYRQPLNLDDASKVTLPTGAGSLSQVHVGDEVQVSYVAGKSGPEVVELKVTHAAGS